MDNTTLFSAEKHWEYTEKALLVSKVDPNIVKIIQYFYIEAMIHGYKHGRRDKDADIA